MNGLIRLGKARTLTGLSVLWMSLAAVSVFADPTQSDNAAVPVEVVIAKPELRERPIVTVGKLMNKSQARLAFRTPGIIESLNAEEGQRVVKGQLLAQLNLAEVNARLAAAEIALQQAQNDRDRIASLREQQMVSIAQLQSAETALARAQSDLEVAKYYQAYASIKAPDDGRILRRMVEPGESVEPSQGIFVFAPDNKGWVMRFGLADKKVIKVQMGDRSDLRLDAMPQLLLTGSVSEIGSAAQASGMFEVEVQLDQAPDFLRAGFTGRVSVYPRSNTPLTYIPIEAVVGAGQGKAEIFVLDRESNTVYRKVVQVIEVIGADVAVAGLQGGESVISSGAQYLEQGFSVNLQR